jgi:signal transduction histidine kinase
MRLVSETPAWAGRVVAAGRHGLGRVTAAPDGPLAAGVLLGVVAMLEVTFAAPPGGAAELSTTLLLGLCATMPLALSRTYVLAAAVTITAAVLLTVASDHRLTAAAAVALVTVGYLLGRHRPRWMSLPLVLPFAAYAVAPVSADAGDRRTAVLLLALAASAAVLGGDRRARLDRTRRAASQQAIADTLLEHAARGERARIARELHDVVAHHISMISVQAETARLATPGMPAEGEKRLLAIGETARAALTEMRRLLGVLREDAGTEPTRRPQPGLAQLNELIDEARDHSATSTRLIVRGRVVPLDPGVGLTAYRIVQEALTNARRHAPGAAVDVELDYTDTVVHLRVRDNGPGPRAAAPATGPAAGHGLVGMRERAAMVGGTLSVGPAPVGGFLVTATLPATRQEERCS